MFNIKIKFFLFVFGMLACLSALANDENGGKISGTVKTVDGKVVAWVSVTLRNKGISTITDEDGDFYFRNLSPGSYTVVISLVGTSTVEKQITVNNRDVRADFVITMSAKMLDNIVIDGRRSPNLQPVLTGRMPVAPIDMPQSFSVINHTVLQNQQVQKLSDAIRNVNGVYLSTTRGNAQETFFARGYRLQGDNFYKNGARINVSAFPEMSSLERVEILKGSASILYGEVVPGGVINLITKEPKFQHGGSVALRTGSYDMWKPMVDLYGPLSKKVAFRINGTYEKANSFKDIVHSRRYYVNPSLKYQINNKTSLLITADYLNDYYTPDFGIGSLDNNIIPDVPRSTFNGTPWQYNKVQQSTAYILFEHRFKKSWNLKSSINYQDYTRDYYSTERIQASLNGDWQRPLNKIYERNNSIFGQVYLTGKFKTGSIEHVILTGMDLEDGVVKSTSFDNPKVYDQYNILDHSKFTPRLDIPGANAVAMVKTPVTRTGIYLQDLISLSNKILVLGGMRWSILNASGSNTFDYQHGEVKYGQSKNFNAFSPRLGIVYKAFPKTSFFVSFANSFSSNPKATDVDGNILDPSFINQYEAGVKNDFLKGGLTVNVIGYIIVNSNLAQTAQFGPDGVTPNSNPALQELVGQTKSKGIELDISGRPAKGLEIMAGYSYNDMRFSKTPNTVGSYISGEQLVGTIPHNANGSFFYSFDGKLKGLKVGAGIYYTGNRYAGWNNKEGQTQNYSRMIFVKGFALVDVSAGYTYKHISFMAKLSNLTNVYNYYVHENYSINPLPPRQLLATLQYQFHR